MIMNEWIDEWTNERANCCTLNARVSVVVRSADVGAGHTRSCTVRRHWELGSRQLRSVRQTTAATPLLSRQRVRDHLPVIYIRLFRLRDFLRVSSCLNAIPLISLMPWLQLRFDYDTTTIRLRHIARACFHSTRFDGSKKWTCQFFVIVGS